jgi:hypothetical protein
MDFTIPCTETWGSFLKLNLATWMRPYLHWSYLFLLRRYLGDSGIQYNVKTTNRFKDHPNISKYYQVLDIIAK